MSRYLYESIPIPLAEWPEPARDAWCVAINPGGVFSDPGSAHDLSPTTKVAYEGAYGRWLRHLSLEEMDADYTHTAMNPAQINAYVRRMSKRISPLSAWSELSNIHNLCFHAWPDHDWSWLRDIVNRLHMGLPASSLKPNQLVPIEDLYNLGFKLMANAPIKSPYRPLDDSVMYRDGLMVALLACTLIRRKNLAQLRIGNELDKIETDWVLSIPARDVKNGVPIECILPQELGQAITTYISEHRPRLMGSADTDALWISKTGSRMSLNRVGQRIAQLTKRYLGKEVSAHKFRHSAATSIAATSPILARIIRPILAHKTHRTSEQYYNRANSIEASRRIADQLQALRTVHSKER